jgi:hypothetical protein
MKTAEEWARLLDQTPNSSEIKEKDAIEAFTKRVKQIQDNSYRAGGLDAAEKIKSIGVSGEYDLLAEAILTHFNNPKLEIPI